jgi:type I restriction enzyme S subunit
MSAAWTTKPLKRACGINRDNLGEDTRQDWEMQYLDISAVDSDGNVAALETYTFSKAPSRARRRVRSGDTVISTVRTYLKAIAHFEQPAENLIASTGFAILSPTDQLDSRFLWRAVQDHSFISQVGANSEGVGYPAIAPTRLAGLPISLPPLAEQRRIAGYLDEAAGKIDRLVALRRRQMELLREQRAALIQQAVTRGLNPNAPLKDSGLPWLGQIPKHWEVVKFNHYVSLRHGHQFMQADFTPDGCKVIKITQLNADGTLDTENCDTVAFDRVDSFRDILIQSGDILMALTGGTIGKVVRVGKVTEPLLQNYRVGHFAPSQKTKLTEDFLYWAMKSDVVMGQILFLVSETGQPNIGKADFSGVFLALPPVSEQEQMVEHINHGLSELHTLHTSYTRQLELLTEYRAALIHESVTGQRAVPAIWLAEKPVGRYAALET